jgi:hypothetical protein
MKIRIPYANESSHNVSTTAANPVNGFCRVTKLRRCRVCGKPDWCGYSNDEQTSICMRVSTGANGTSRNGGNIFHHNRLFLVASPRIATKQAQPTIEIAPIEIRNAVYQELVRRSPAVKYCSQLIEGPNGLLSRGMHESDALNYGALPPTKKQRSDLAYTLNNFLKVRFPEFNVRSTHPAIIGVPGFWKDEAGNLQLGNSRDYSSPLLVIPYRDDQGRIQACQLRLHRNDLRIGEKRYRWLACPSSFRGASSGTPIHFTFKSTDLTPGNPVIITEGALKADVLVSLRPKARVIAMSGVSCSHAEIIEAARPCNVLIAFDADYRTNPAVARQLAHLIAVREQDITIHRLKVTTRIVTWQRYKGIDDAVLANVALKAMPISQWLSTLKGQPLLEVQALWQQMNYSPLT